MQYRASLRQQPCCYTRIGNGKSLAIEYAKYMATSRSSPTFSIDSSVELDLLKELLNELPTGSLVFFEGDVFHAIDCQQTIAERNLIVCFTSRTTTMRVVAQSLYNNARTTVRVFDCNRLNSSELDEFHDLIDSMGFWPRELRDLSREMRIERLASSYDASTCSIVLSIFENEVVRDQITSIWSKSLPELRPHLDHFLTASYMNMIDVECPPFLLKGFQPFDFRRGEAITNEIISLSHSGVLSFASSVIGEFVVQNLADKESTIGAVVRFCNYMDGHHQQQRHQWIVRRLLRFWNLSRSAPHVQGAV